VNTDRRAAMTAAGLLLCVPTSALAQRADRKLHIAILVGDVPAPQEEQALLQGLREHGFVEGRNLIVERGYADGRVQQVPGIARDFAALKLDAVVATCTPTTRVAMQTFGNSATSTPIIMAAVADPVGQRLVSSLARPGVNVTGRSSQAEDLVSKKLELLARVLGKPTTVAVLVDSNSAVHPRMFEALVPVAQQMKLELVKVEAGRRPCNYPRLSRPPHNATPARCSCCRTNPSSLPDALKSRHWRPSIVCRPSTAHASSSMQAA
jgi:putative ABC transport system substrate-binding protein